MIYYLNNPFTEEQQEELGKTDFITAPSYLEQITAYQKSISMLESQRDKKIFERKLNKRLES